ncbi:MAG: hypothetical protein LUH47_10320 [Clostridiales bacterium]|nr:hypothetical protein [Clostridiales bacterium]
MVVDNEDFDVPDINYGNKIAALSAGRAERRDRGMLTIETFGPNNRTKHIGHSMYRIAADDTVEIKPSTIWHIYECYNNLESGEWAVCRGCFTTDLQKVIDIFNGITKEKEIINMRRGASYGKTN